jgi:hypothetical protein
MKKKWEKRIGKLPIRILIAVVYCSSGGYQAFDLNGTMFMRNGFVWSSTAIRHLAVLCIITLQ